MTTLELPAIQGHLATGWLPALGLVRVLAGSWPEMMVSWHPRSGHLILHDGPATAEVAAEVLMAHIDCMPPGQVLPGADPEYPQPKARRLHLRDTPWEGPHGRQWQDALVSPAGRMHPAIQTHAQQTLRGLLDAMLSALRAEPDLMLSALTGLGLTSRYPAGLWILRDWSEVKPMASPGRDWLIVQGLPWSPVSDGDDAPDPGAIPAPGWTWDRVIDDARGPILRWQLWTEPHPVAAIPRLARTLDRDGPVYAAYRSRRRVQDPPVLYTSQRPLAWGPPTREEITIWLSASEAATLTALAEESGQKPEKMARALILSALSGKFDSLYSSLRRIGEVKSTANAVIDRAIRDGMPDAEIARLTGRDRVGIWRRRKQLQEPQQDAS